MNVTSLLSEQVTACFSSHGVLAKRWPDYVPREGQISMAQAVTQHIQEGGALVVQAGTGVERPLLI